MREQMIPWIDLRPIEDPHVIGYYLFNDIRGKITEIKRGEIYPILTIPYKDDTLIVLDGHRRTIANILTGRLEVLVKVYETNSDIANYPCDFIKNGKGRLDSIDHIINIYESEIIPDLNNYKINTFKDYPVLKIMSEMGIGI